MHCAVLTDFPVLLFVSLDAVADEDENLTVGGTSFIVSNDVELMQHFRVNSDGDAFYSHLQPSPFLSR